MKTQRNLLIASTSVLAAGVAQGAVDYSGPINYQITGTKSFGLDLNKDATLDYNIRFDGDSTSANTLKPFVDCRPNVVTGVNPNSWVLSKANGGSPLTLAGTMIDAGYAAAFPANKVGYLYQQWDNGTVVGDWPSTARTEGYVGLELVNGTDVNYGWVHLGYDPTATDKTLTVFDYAYETSPNTGLMAVAGVPEPTALSLLGLGGAALFLRRRK